MTKPRARQRRQPFRQRPAGPAPGSQAASADGPQRIAKLMAQRGLCSRREAERLMAAGQVVVDGQVVTEQGSKASPTAEIEIADRGRGWLGDRVTILFHKPVGIVSTQPEGAQIPAWKLLTREHLHGEGDPAAIERVLSHPYYLNVAGRLDRDSRGLLLMTQDGTVVRRITGERKVRKVYEVACSQTVGQDQIDKLRDKWELDGKPLLPMRVKRISNKKLRFELKEGRKHQIRRVCDHVGLKVVDLLRTEIGPWQLGDLPEGRWRLLGADELDKLRK